MPVRLMDSEFRFALLSSVFGLLLLVMVVISALNYQNFKVLKNEMVSMKRDASEASSRETSRFATPSASRIPVAPAMPATSAPSLATPSLDITLSDQLMLATARKGNGVEHTLIRQLVADPMRYGFNGVASETAVRRWAEHEAHIIALRAGYVDWKFGAWIGVSIPNRSAYVLQRDNNGKFTVAEYVATSDDDFGSSPQPKHVRSLAASVTQAQFLGWPDVVQEHPLPANEYLYTGA